MTDQMPLGFWLHHSNKGASDLPRIAAELAGDPKRLPPFVLGPLNSPSSLRPLYAVARAMGPVIFLPHGHMLDRPGTARARKHFPWLYAGSADHETPFHSGRERPATSPAWAEWMREGVRHQMSEALLGKSAPPPSTLVIPCPQLTGAGGRAEFEPIWDALLTVAEEMGTDKVWAEVTVDRTYLRQEEHLTRLANAIIDLPVAGVAFRCFQGELAPITDQGVLTGFKDIVTAASESGVELLLPNSGWLGWLAMAWGAGRFSAGTSKGSWLDRMPSPMNAPTPIASIFEPNLLRHVRVTELTDVQRSGGYVACECGFCEDWLRDPNAVRASKHQLALALAAGRDLAAADMDARRASIRQTLEDAIRFRDSLPGALKERVEAGFLDKWLASVT